MFVISFLFNSFVHHIKFLYCDGATTSNYYLQKNKKVMLVMTKLLINTKKWYSQQQSDPNSDICTSTIPQTVFNVVTGVSVV
jgi:hypothetical protein